MIIVQSLPVVFDVEAAGIFLPAVSVTDLEPEMKEVAPTVFPDVDVAFPPMPLDTADFWRLCVTMVPCEVGLLVFCSELAESVF